MFVKIMEANGEWEQVLLAPGENVTYCPCCGTRQRYRGDGKENVCPNEECDSSRVFTVTW